MPFGSGLWSFHFPSVQLFGADKYISPKQSPEDHSGKQTVSYTQISQARTVITITACLTQNYVVTNGNCSLGRMWISRQKERMNELKPVAVQRGSGRISTETHLGFSSPGRVCQQRHAPTQHTKPGATVHFSAQLSCAITASCNAVPNSSTSGQHFCTHVSISEQASVVRSQNVCIPLTWAFLNIFPQHEWEM